MTHMQLVHAQIVIILGVNEYFFRGSNSAIINFTSLLNGVSPYWKEFGFLDVDLI